MMESLIKSSSATSSNSDTGYADNPKTIAPPRYRLIWPLTFTVKKNTEKLECHWNMTPIL